MNEIKCFVFFNHKIIRCKLFTILSSPKILILLPLRTLDTIIGEDFTELKEVDSTNNYAMACIKNDGAKHGSAWFAHAQTAGKGQRGKRWEALRSENILLSLAIKPHSIRVLRQFELSAGMALATIDFLNNHIAGFKIKWPNDIYWGDTKAAGILIENVIKGKNWQWAVVGIGININQVTFDSSIKNPISLKQITGNNYNTVTLAKELCNYIQKRYLQLKFKPFEEMLQQYNCALYKLNKEVLLKENNKINKYFIKRVTETGLLVAEDSEKKIKEFREAEWMFK